MIEKATCTLTHLKQHGSYSCELTIAGKPTACFILYHQQTIHSFVNRCPHTGVNLDWVPGQFLDSQRQFIQCATHGALFNIEDGLCVRGPCLGDRLQGIENRLVEDTIYLLFNHSTT